jgi:hypothetical protein
MFNKKGVVNMSGILKGKALKHHNQWHSDIDNAIYQLESAAQQLKKIKNQASMMGLDDWSVVEGLNDFNLYELSSVVKSLDPVYESLGTVLDREYLEAEEVA